MSPACASHALRAFGPLLLASLLTGCGGITRQESLEPVATVAAVPASARPVVHILPVQNETGRKEVDDLRHYIHLKAARLLEETGGYAVLADELLAEAGLARADTTAHTAAPDLELAIHIIEANEIAGATVSVAIFSSQQQTGTVRLQARWTETATGRTRETSGRGQNRKGAWGALAQVNRATLLKETGFWQFDRSLLGGAATQALAQCLQ